MSKETARNAVMDQFNGTDTFKSDVRARFNGLNSMPSIPNLSQSSPSKTLGAKSK